jgi:hypothetical protein
MSELPSHGTGWAESEVLLDVLTVFNGDWSDASPPDFTTVQRRLHESFDLRELRNLETATHALAALIDRELALRGSDPEY